MTKDQETFRDLLGNEYVNGCHLIFVEKTSQLEPERKWDGYGFKDGQMYHMDVANIDQAVRGFARTCGRPQSVQVFDNQSEAHAAYPKFFRPDASNN